MYLLLKIGGFSIAMLVYQRVHQKEGMNSSTQFRCGGLQKKHYNHCKDSRHFLVGMSRDEFIPFFGTPKFGGLEDDVFVVFQFSFVFFLRYLLGIPC